MDQLPRLGKRELICLLLFTCNYVVSVWRGFLFLWVLWMAYVILLWHSLSLPYNHFTFFSSLPSKALTFTFLFNFQNKSVRTKILSKSMISMTLYTHATLTNDRLVMFGNWYNQNQIPVIRTLYKMIRIANRQITKRTYT